MFHSNGSRAAHALSTAIWKTFHPSQPSPQADACAEQPEPEPQTRGSAASTANGDEALTWLIASLIKTGRLETALPLIEHACQIKPAQPELHNSRGLVMQALRRHAEALTAFETALQLRPDYTEALQNRQHLLDSMPPDLYIPPA